MFGLGTDLVGKRQLILRNRSRRLQVEERSEQRQGRRIPGSIRSNIREKSCRTHQSQSSAARPSSASTLCAGTLFSNSAFSDRRRSIFTVPSFILSFTRAIFSLILCSSSSSVCISATCVESVSSATGIVKGGDG